MKKTLLFCTLFLASILSSYACDFEFTTDGNKKTAKAGEEFVVNVKLTLTHRTCKVAAKDTKFKMDGMQVVGATDWKEIGTGVFTRQVKVKVADKVKKAGFTATRTCDKEGGFGAFSILVQ